MKSYIGVDIGKTSLDIYLNGKSLVIPNTEKEIVKLIKRLKNKDLSESLVIFEATGGYERVLRRLLREAEIAYHIAHPNKVRALAKAKGLLAKTDKIDAQLIAHYGELMQPEADVLEVNAEMRELLKRREQLILEKNREKNRLDKELITAVKRSIQKHVKWLEKEIESLEKKSRSYYAF